MKGIINGEATSVEGLHLLKQQGSMGRSYDRISNLPDPILQSILSLMPLKSAIRTRTLAKSWRHLWEYNLISATTLDFGEDFACTQWPKDFVENVNRYLQLHSNQKLERLSVLFCPFELYLNDIERWITFAVEKGVEELVLDLSQGYVDPRNGEFTDGRNPFILPNSLYDCKSLTKLSLSRCDLQYPLDFSSFSGLQSLSLRYVNITEDMLEDLLIDCPLLESLSLRNCQHLSAIYVTAPDLRLRKLVVVDCQEVLEMEISAPKLESLHYCGKFYFTSIHDISSLVDAFICSIGRQETYYSGECVRMSDLARAKILTLCPETLMQVTLLDGSNPELIPPLLQDVQVPIHLPNLQELQLLMESMTDEHLTYIYNFFRLCPSPSIEKLFIRLPRSVEHPISSGVNVVEEPLGVVFDHLKVIKVSNFKGSRTEMRLIKFLLEKAVALEFLILVAPPIAKDGYAEESPPRVQNEERMSLRILRGQLLLLPKSSPRASIKLCEFLDDDNRVNPTHLEDYCNDVYFSGTWRHMFSPLSVEEAICALN